MPLNIRRLRSTYKESKSKPNIHQSQGGFLDGGKLPLDPWQNSYVYIRTSNSFDIISLGADKKEGGSGDDEDIKLSTCK